MVIIPFSGFKSGIDDICLIDSGTIYTILKDRKYFSHLKMGETNINTISGSVKLIEGSGRVSISLHGGTTIIIHKALSSLKSQRNLLTFKDICRNGYHIETMEENGLKYLYNTQINSGNKILLEKSPSFSSSLYSVKIYAIEMHHSINHKFTDPTKFIIWHDRLGYQGTIMM
jgi:hypothetical protein